MKHLFTLIFVLCIGAAGFLGWRVYQKQQEYRAGQESINEVYALMNEAAEEVRLVDPGISEEELNSRKLAQYAILHEKNPDMIGWITIEGTPVNYPVMYTPKEPDYYLYKNFRKEYSVYGSIYLESSCKLDGSTKNLLLYGHHMRNGDMFASLQEYDSKDYWKEHSVIEFNTLDEICEYEVIAAFKQPAAQVDADFMEMLQAGTEERYGEFLKFVKRNQFYDTGKEAQWPEQLVTLATCEYTQKDGRFFVVAKRIEN